MPTFLSYTFRQTLPLNLRHYGLFCENQQQNYEPYFQAGGKLAHISENGFDQTYQHVVVTIEA